MMTDVKRAPDESDTSAGTRPTRAERATQTRLRIAEAAYGLFAEIGYAATTMDAVATRAHVAVQTVYFVFHTKPQLLVETLRIAGGGAERTPDVMARSWIQEVRAAPDGARRLALIAEHGTQIYRRLGPVWPAVLAAMGEPDVREAWQAVVRGRHDGMRTMVGEMADRGELRAGLSAELATDILFGVHRHELYLAFTGECGWSFDRYRAWTFLTLCSQLLPPGVAVAAVASGSPATTGLELRQGLADLVRP